MVCQWAAGSNVDAMFGIELGVERIAYCATRRKTYAQGVIGLRGDRGGGSAA
jgi:hypothetical protein